MPSDNIAPAADNQASRFLRAALALAEAGFPVFPCEEGGKRPACPNGFKDATTNPARVRELWAPNPNFNVAIYPGGIELVVVDLDVKKADGVAAWAKLCAENGWRDDTYTVETPSGGRHLYYSGTAPSSAGKLGAGIDTRGVGGYVLAVPSIVGGKPYRVVEDRDIADAPAGLAEALATTAVAVRAPSVDLDTAGNIARARGAIEAELRRYGSAPAEGQGSDERAYKLAAELRNLGLSDEAAADLLHEAWAPHFDHEWLAAKVANATAYAQNEPGAWAVPPAKEAFGATVERLELNTPPEPDAKDDGAPQRIDGEDENEDFADWPVSAGDYKAREFPPVAELVPGWIEKGIVTYLEGPGGTHKSRTGLQDAICLAAGVDVFGERAARTPCLYINYENPPDEMARRVQQMARGLKRLAGDPDLDVRDVAIWELRDKPRPMLVVKKDGEITITRFGRRVLKYLAGQRRHTFVVFDGLMDAIIFEGSTRNEDAVAIRIVKLLDRWCVEYDFTAYAIIHPSRAAERQGITGGSYATAWSTKPRSIQAMSKTRLKAGEVVTAQTYERKVVKRSHGKDGAAMVLEYRNGCILPVAGKSSTSPEIAAAKLLLQSQERLRRDGRLGAGRDARKVTNEHWMVQEFRALTGNDRFTVRDLIAAADGACRAGLLGYNGAPSGSHGTRDGAPAGYCAPPPLDAASTPAGYAEDPTEPDDTEF